jgi:hypothetical protein
MHTVRIAITLQQIDKTRLIMSSDPNTSKRKFGPYNIEVTNEECVNLFYMANLMLSAFSGIRYDRSTGIDLDKISMRPWRRLSWSDNRCSK